MLNDRTILVVEAEFLIALDVQRMLEGLNARQMLFARTTEEAHELSPHWSCLGLAVVEIQQDRPLSIALVQGLRARGIPVVLSSADSTIQRGHPEFPGVPILIKPMSEEDLASAIAAASRR